MDFTAWEVAKFSASIIGAILAGFGLVLVYIWNATVKDNKEKQQKDEKAREAMKVDIERHIDLQVASLKESVTKHDDQIEEMYLRTEKIGTDVINLMSCVNGHKKLCDERHK